jgi:hypothetical protein
MSGPRDANDILREKGPDALRDAFDRAHDDAQQRKRESKKRRPMVMPMARDYGSSAQPM